jgi:predicted nucleic acid-binding protein
MRYVVLDTDVASRAIKGQLGDPMAARLTGAAWCVTFVTVGELWQ